MLNYHPSGDLYHCVYRLFLLKSYVRAEQVEWERLRLMDFYFLFPHLLKTLKVPREYIAYKRTFAAIQDPYEEIGSAKRLFFQLGSIQDNTIRFLVAKGYFERDAFAVEGKIKSTNSPPEVILNAFKLDPKVNADWFDPFMGLFQAIPLNGNDGLKVRTEMMEHRYDSP